MRRALFWIAIAGALAIALVVFLAPIVRTPLSGDEAFNSYFTGLMGYQHMTPWQWFVRYTYGVATTQGRFFPGLTALQVAKFTLTHDNATLKWANIVAIGINLLTFTILAARIAGRRVAVIAAVAAIAAMQVRAFYDPIIEITVELQVVCEFILLGCLAAVDYADRPRPLALALLAATYLIASLTYEIAYPFIAVFVVLIALRGSRTAARNALIALGIVFAGLIVANLVLRHVVGVAPTSEYALKPDVLAYLVTLFDQTASAIPLTYFFADPSHLFGADPLHALGMTRRAVGTAVLAALAIFATALPLRSASGRARRRLAPAWFTAACLFVVPSLLIALSGRWQHEVRFALPYQPVYLSAFGAALLLGLAGAWLIALVPRYQAFTTAGVAFVAGATLFITYQANLRIDDLEAGSIWGPPGNALVAAERDGVFDTIPDGSTILLDSAYPIYGSDKDAGIWAARYQIYMYTHRRYHVWVRADPPANPAVFCAEPIRAGTCERTIPNLFAVWVQVDPGIGSRTIAMPVRRFEVGTDPRAPVTPLGSHVLLFEQSAAIAAGAAPAPSASFYTWTPAGKNGSYRFWLGRSACPNIPAPFTGTNSSIDLVFGPGFYGTEGPPGFTWHWAGPVSSFRVVNTSRRRRTIEASMQFQTSVPGAFPLVVRDGTHVSRLTLSTKPVRFAFHRTLDPGASATITLQTSAPRVATNGDPRDLRFEAFDASAMHCGP